GGGEGLLLEDAPPDHRIDLGILGLHGRQASVEHRDLPVAPGARTLATDDELARLSLAVGRIRHDRGHDGADEPDAHDDHDLLPLGGGRIGEPLEASELGGVVALLRQRELFTGRVDRLVWHGTRPPRWKRSWSVVDRLLEYCLCPAAVNDRASRPTTGLATIGAGVLYRITMELSMSLEEAMRTQRAIRRLKADPVDDALVLHLIEL